ncbi:MAG: cation:dicarboxylase symporter family transporter [Acuticoccus sp.]
MPLWVLLGAVSGVVVGLFFGDLTAPLQSVSRIYAAMMQIAAVPYLMSSLLHGLASISRADFLRTMRFGLLAYGLLIAVTFGFLFLLIVAIGGTTPPALIDGNAQGEFSAIIRRVIPINIFQDATQNYLPAVVIFSILYGIAMQTTPTKGAVVDALASIKSASVKIWQWVVLLAPMAIFAVTASIAGTTPFQNMISLSTYVVAVIAGALLLGFVIIPALLEAFAPRSLRVVWPELRNGLLIAVTTSLSVVALPFIQRAVDRYFDEIGERPDDAQAITETTIAVSYPLAQLGNFFIWVFIIFTASYYRIEISSAERLLLPVVTWLSGIGSPSTSIDAVDFLVGWLNLPDPAVGLYAGLFTLTRYGQVVASVMGFAFMAIMVSALTAGRVRIRPLRIVALVVPMVAAMVALVVSLRVVAPSGASVAEFHFPQLRTSAIDGVKVSFAQTGDNPACQLARPAGEASPAQAGSGVDADANADADTDTEPPSLSRIRQRGNIRIGYAEGIIPFSYRNRHDELVGFDVEYMLHLAKSLNVDVCFIGYTWGGFDKLLEDGTVDIAISGIYVGQDRLQNFLVSDPYFEDHIVLLTETGKADSYLTREQVEAHAGGTVTVFNDPFMVDLAHTLMPKYDVEKIRTYYEGPDFELGLWTREQAWAFAVTNNKHTAVVVRDFGGTLLVAYMMPRDALALQRYVNYWLRLQEKNGFAAAMTRKWLHADPALDREVRWSVLRNVLGIRLDQVSAQPTPR